MFNVFNSSVNSETSKTILSNNSLKLLAFLTVFAFSFAMITGAGIASDNGEVTIEIEDDADVYPAGQLEPNDNNGDDPAEHTSPILVSLSADDYNENVRIAPISDAGNLELWAKDTEENWYDIVEAGWGPEDGFSIDDKAETEVYPAGEEAFYEDIEIEVVQVNNDNDGVVGSTTESISIGIQPAIDNADEGDKIEVAEGTYKESVKIDVNDLTLESVEGPAETELNGDISFVEDSDATELTVEGFEFTGDAGIALNLRPGPDEGELNLINNVFTGTGDGDMMAFNSDSAHFSGEIRGNKFNDRKGISLRAADMTVVDNTFAVDEEAIEIFEDEDGFDRGDDDEITIEDNTFEGETTDAYLEDVNDQGDDLPVAGGLDAVQDDNEFDPDAIGINGDLVPTAREDEVLNADTGDRFDGDNAIQDAVGDADKDHTLLVGAGTYKENVTIDVEGLTLKSTEGAEETMIDATGFDDAIIVEGEDQTISGFEIRNTKESGIKTDGVDNLTIKNNLFNETFRGTRSDFAGAENTNITIDGNVFKTDFGITQTEGISGLYVFDNEFLPRNEGIGIGGGAESIEIVGNTFNGTYEPSDAAIKIHDTGDFPGITDLSENKFIEFDDGYGILNQFDEELDAARNYWGHPTGPGGEGTGQGANVSENVEYIPWLPVPWAQMGVEVLEITPPSPSVTRGRSRSFSAYIEDMDGEAVEVTDDVSWSIVSDTAGSVIDDNVVTTDSVGSTDVQAEYDYDEDGNMNVYVHDSITATASLTAEGESFSVDPTPPGPPVEVPEEVPEAVVEQAAVDVVTRAASVDVEAGEGQGVEVEVPAEDEDLERTLIVERVSVTSAASQNIGFNIRPLGREEVDVETREDHIGFQEVEVDGEIEDSIIVFSVRKDTLEERGTDLDNVVKERYNPDTGEWEALDTWEEEELDERIRFGADVPEFSLFAVSAEEVEEEPVEEPVDEEPVIDEPLVETPGFTGRIIESPGVFIFGVISVVLLFVYGGYTLIEK